MPKYIFRTPLSIEPDELDFADDQEAWGQAVVYMGELLKDIDGGLPARTEWKLSVCEGTRTVAEIEVAARKC
jgi:hypothetical protein